MVENTVTHRDGNPVVIKIWYHFMFEFNQCKGGGGGWGGKIKQTEKSSLSLMHTTSQCLLLAKKQTNEKNTSHQSFNQLLPCMPHFLTLTLTHTFSLSHKSSLYGESKKTQTVNIVFASTWYIQWNSAANAINYLHRMYMSHDSMQCVLMCYCMSVLVCASWFVEYM